MRSLQLLRALKIHLHFPKRRNVRLRQHYRKRFLHGVRHFVNLIHNDLHGVAVTLNVRERCARVTVTVGQVKTLEK